MYKVFYNNHFILIRKIKDFFHNQDLKTIVVNNPKHTILKTAFAQFIKGQESYIIESENPKLIFEDLTLLFDQKIQAAGGIVMNEKEEILVIKRNGYLDLPKGMIENSDESIECGAIREVEEETAVQNLHSKYYNSTTYHVFWQHNASILKETHWFSMFAPSTQNFKAQKEEGIEWVKWMSKIEIAENLASFWPSLHSLLK